MTASVTLRMDGPLDHLRVAWQAAESLLADLPLERHMSEGDARETRYNVLVAIQELLTNVYRHGYAEDAASKAVEIDLCRDEDEFRFELRDRAAAFDPTAADPDPRPGSDPDAMPTGEGGFGLVIVREMLDSLHYERRDGWNVLRGGKMVGTPVGAGGGADGSAGDSAEWPSA